METSKKFTILYYDGTTWQAIKQYTSGTDFVNDTFYHGIVYINEGSYIFPTNMKIKFRCDASLTSDDVYIDEVTVSAK